MSDHKSNLDDEYGCKRWKCSRRIESELNGDGWELIL